MKATVQLRSAPYVSLVTSCRLSVKEIKNFVKYNTDFPNRMVLHVQGGVLGIFLTASSPDHPTPSRSCSSSKLSKDDILQH